MSDQSDREIQLQREAYLNGRAANRGSHELATYMAMYLREAEQRYPLPSIPTIYTSSDGEYQYRFNDNNGLEYRHTKWGSNAWTGTLPEMDRGMIRALAEDGKEET